MKAREVTIMIPNMPHDSLVLHKLHDMISGVHAILF